MPNRKAVRIIVEHGIPDFELKKGAPDVRIGSFAVAPPETLNKSSPAHIDIAPDSNGNAQGLISYWSTPKGDAPYAVLLVKWNFNIHEIRGGVFLGYYLLTDDKKNFRQSARMTLEPTNGLDLSEPTFTWTVWPKSREIGQIGRRAGTGGLDFTSDSEHGGESEEEEVAIAFDPSDVPRIA